MRKRTGRKLLVATLGVAAVSYVACGGGTVANLMPPPQDGGADADAANDGANDIAATDTARDNAWPLDLVANIVAPR